MKRFLQVKKSHEIRSKKTRTHEMGAIRAFLVVFALWFSLFSMHPTIEAADPGFDIELCLFELSEVVKQANASFHINYRFEFDDNGKACNIEKVNDDYVGMEMVKECLKAWNLKEFAGINKKLNLIMFWKHGVGWTSMHFGCEGMSYTIRIPGQVKQYGAGRFSPNPKNFTDPNLQNALSSKTP